MDTPTVLITGGSKGIGLATAELVLSQEMRVILLARDETGLRKAKAKLVEDGANADDIHIEAMDMADTDAIGNRIPALPFVREGLFGLVNNAAVEILKPVTALSAADLDATWRVNMLAPVLMIQACYPFLKMCGGSVVNIGSVVDEEHLSAYAMYGASKSFLVAFSKHAAKDLGFDGVRVNVVSPGPIDTPLMEEITRTHLGEEAVAEARRKVPIEQRFGRPDEVAEAIWFALSGPRYLHGADIRIHGGLV